MKKRLLSLFLVLAMVCAMSVSASAAAHSDNTENGLSSLYVTARLTMSNEDAVATTTDIDRHDSIMRTTVTFVYTNVNNHRGSISGSGTTLASARPDDMLNELSAIQAESQHEVRGGAAYGTWSYSLIEYRYG